MKVNKKTATKVADSFGGKVQLVGMECQFTRRECQAVKFMIVLRAIDSQTFFPTTKSNRLCMIVTIEP
jgi:hypothetical protein